jgi:hypothetical protein
VESEEDEDSEDAEHGSEGEEHGEAETSEGHDKDANEEDENNNEEGNSDNESNDDAEDEEEEDEDAPREPIDLTVRVVDDDGEIAELPLSRFSYLQPQLEVELRKAIFDDPDRESEPVFQSFAFPLEWFVDVNPGLDPARLQRLEFVFDRTEKGVVIIDSVGFRASPDEGN